jgi:hypothetical protein
MPTPITITGYQNQKGASRLLIRIDRAAAEALVTGAADPAELVAEVEKFLSANPVEA